MAFEFDMLMLMLLWWWIKLVRLL